ncbi:MAG: MFS transporter [Prevotella sp.]|jgi:DHA3 family macrolide efflux protein-like MFS transporter|nr:MFS transporter [Prevotella sp.]
MTKLSQIESKDWKNKALLFILSQGISLFGSSLVEFAIIWYITLKTNSGTMMTWGILCVFVPRLIISIFSGVWADRYNRKVLIIYADLATAFITLLLAFVFYLGYESIYIICIALALRSIATGIQQPAINSLIPLIVPKEHLMKISGLNGSLQSLIMILSPLMSGALLSFTSLINIFLIDVVTAIIAVIILCFVKTFIRTSDYSIKGHSYLKDLKFSWSLLRKDCFTRSIIFLYAMYFFLTVPLSYLSPLLVSRTFGEDVWRLSATEVSIGIGTLLGGIIITSLKNGISLKKILVLSCISTGISVSVLPYSFYFSVFLSFILVSGISLAFFNSSCMVLIQKRYEIHMQGRIMSMVQLFTTTAIPIGMLLWGPLGDYILIENIYLLTGIGLIISGLLAKKSKAIID